VPPPEPEPPPDEPLTVPVPVEAEPEPDEPLVVPLPLLRTGADAEGGDTFRTGAGRVTGAGGAAALGAEGYTCVGTPPPVPPLPELVLLAPPTERTARMAAD
jgi:hypothetical protein